MDIETDHTAGGPGISSENLLPEAVAFKGIGQVAQLKGGLVVGDQGVHGKQVYIETVRAGRDICRIVKNAVYTGI